VRCCGNIEYIGFGAREYSVASSPLSKAFWTISEHWRINRRRNALSRTMAAWYSTLTEVATLLASSIR
jgi:hypothetical protein